LTAQHTATEVRFFIPAAAAIASIALAALIFHCYEGRLLQLKRYFRHRFCDMPGDLDGKEATDLLVAESGICEPG
jgi:hypothetical protein